MKKENALHHENKSLHGLEPLEIGQKIFIPAAFYELEFEDIRAPEVFRRNAVNYSQLSGVNDLVVDVYPKQRIAVTKSGSKINLDTWRLIKDGRCVFPSKQAFKEYYQSEFNHYFPQAADLIVNEFAVLGTGFSKEQRKINENLRYLAHFDQQNALREFKKKTGYVSPMLIDDDE